MATPASTAKTRTNGAAPGCSTPKDHSNFGAEILRHYGYPEEMVRAMLTHGDHTGIPRESLMEPTLYAVDELSGFIRAVALVRPSESLEDVSPRSVRRKLKDKGFAEDVKPIAAQIDLEQEFRRADQGGYLEANAGQAYDSVLLKPLVLSLSKELWATLTSS